MEIAHGYMNSFLDMKKYPKALELDSTGIGDLFGIEDLLDLSNEEIGGPPIAEASMHSNGLSAAAFTEAHNSSAMAGFLEIGDICVPCEDLAQLEWLSNFVEESFSSPPAFSPELIASHEAGEQKTTDGKPVSGSASPISVLENSSTPMLESYSPVVLVRGRARSKRSRTGVCFWNTRILSTTDTAAGILESPATSASSAEFYTFAQEPTGEGYLPPAAKKPKNSQSGKACRKGSPEAVQQGRRCLHCGIQRTPQWRAGPMGPKTLCNACGVRYKSGRLLPEYRPAASPTFVETIHSNSHRKVLELRRKKEVVGPAEDILRDLEDDNVHVDELVVEEEEEEEDQLELIPLPMCERPCT